MMKGRELMNKRKILLWIISFVMVLELLCNVFVLRAEAADKTLTLSRAVTFAMNNSREYKTTRSKIFLKQAEYETNY